MNHLLDEVKRRLRYEPQTGLIFWRDGNLRAGKQAFTYKNKRGYFSSTFRHSSGTTSLSAHRVAWALHFSQWPTGQIDHINGDRSDNRIENLRDVINAENAKNMSLSKSNSSGVCGVYRHSQTKKWTAQINVNGRAIGLGCFDLFSEAVIARKAAERVLGYHENHGKRQTNDMLAGDLNK